MNFFKKVMQWMFVLMAASGLYTLGSYLMNQQSTLWFHIGLILNVAVGIGLLVLVWESLCKLYEEPSENNNNQKEKKDEQN